MKRVLIFLLIICFVLVLPSCSSDKYEQALELEKKCEYDSAMEIYNTILSYKDSQTRYNLCIQKLECVSNIKENELRFDLDTLNEFSKELSPYLNGEKRLLDDSLYTEAKNINDKINKFLTAFEIVDDLDLLKSNYQTILDFDYSSIIQGKDDLLKRLKEDSENYLLVKNPTPEYVISCLSKLKMITEIEEATEEVDPNGGLSKENGYTSNIFFKISWIKDEAYKDKTPLEIGSMGGGCIEIYRNETDAGRRNSDLVLSRMMNPNQGEYLIMGTVIIRLSDKLEKLQGKILMEQIQAVLIGK